MKKKLTVITIALLPLITTGIFALFGIFFSLWVYLLLAIICLVAAGILWLIYKDMERKITEAKRSIKEMRK